MAKTLPTAHGIAGKKGVLWWEIHRIIKAKRPKYALLENVDRLLKSPRVQRGRDFAVMLASLSDLGYSVEWRVVDSFRIRDSPRGGNVRSYWRFEMRNGKTLRPSSHQTASLPEHSQSNPSPTLSPSV